MTHAFLALSCLALLGMIAFQDWRVTSLRNDTISAGLTGPYHWYLDASYLLLAIALVLAFRGLMEALAILSSIALLLTAATNTFGPFVDRLTGGKHSLWHSRFTIATFVCALLLQLAGDHGYLWGLTVLTVAIPAGAYGYFHTEKTDIDGTVIAASSAAEKLFVSGLAIWLIVWAL
jgi:hypothetical protein